MLNSCNSQEFFLSLPQNSMIMLEKEYKYYKDHQNELVSKYPDKYLIIKDQRPSLESNHRLTRVKTQIDSSEGF